MNLLSTPTIIKAIIGCQYLLIFGFSMELSLTLYYSWIFQHDLYLEEILTVVARYGAAFILAVIGEYQLKSNLL